MDPLDVVFQNLDRWRHMPAYQLERRADIFFSVYLKGVVEEHTGLELADEILPELPIKRDLIWPDHPSDKSVKVDYVLFAKDRRRVVFVELKTDAASRRERQDHYLETARRIGMRRIVEGIRSILLSTSAHQKYHHLTVALARLGFLETPPDLASYVFPRPRPGLRAHIERIAVTALDPAIDVLYVQPDSAGDDRCIGFDRFADYVARFDDDFSRRFAHHLRAWAAVAGEREPA